MRGSPDPECGWRYKVDGLCFDSERGHDSPYGGFIEACESIRALHLFESIIYLTKACSLLTLPGSDSTSSF